MGCGDSRVVPPSLPRREDDPSEEAVLFEQHDPPGTKNVPQIPLEEEMEVDEYEGEFDFITENSDEHLVRKVMSEFRPPTNLDLVIIGIPCTRLLSAVQRTKLEEAKILESLRNEGLIARTLKNSPNATGFEIVERNEAPYTKVSFVPQSLRKEDRPEKSVTSEMINEKLAKAEERRKKVEEEKKARAVTSKPRPSRRDEEREEQRIQQMEKWETGIRNRELQLLETQEKLREKHQKIKGVNFKKSFKGLDPFDNDSD